MLSLSLLFIVFSPFSQLLASKESSICNEKCGDFDIAFPFYLNTSSCATFSTSFHLTCVNYTAVFLSIGPHNYRVLQFLPDGVLVDFPGSSYACRQYNDLNGFGFARNNYFALSIDNVVGLYDCEDSSLCKASCETSVLPGCGSSVVASVACCYPLSDHSVWHVGDEFSTFSQFGCRGFSSWVILAGNNHCKRGVKLEWAVPINSSSATCAKHAYRQNATTVESGMRCACMDGYIGDGFRHGAGCLKSCIKDGREAHGKDCDTKSQGKHMTVIVVGVIAPIFVIVSLIALFCLLKQPLKSGTSGHNQTHFHDTSSFRKACRTRLFTYSELDQATKGFENDQKLTDRTTTNTVHTGVLSDGSHIAVQKIQCENEKTLIEILSKVEILFPISHVNMSNILGCCINNANAPLIVYEYPANGTLQTHLNESRGLQTGLDWYKRLKIAQQTSTVLSFLQHQISPPIYHNDLKSSSIFLDHEFSVKISLFGLDNNSYNNFNANDVYYFGVVLLEILAGSNHLDVSETVFLQKIKNAKLEEIIDPFLYYHEQPCFQQEQMQRTADLAARCLLFGGEGKIGMVDVARELVHMNGSCSVSSSISKRGAFEETFSNSSLLQMISLSPDSAYVP